MTVHPRMRGEHGIVLAAGQMAVVPKGIEHKPGAAAETRLRLIEPRGVVNTVMARRTRGRWKTISGCDEHCCKPAGGLANIGQPRRVGR